MPATPSPLVHLELHTGDLPRACGFYSNLLGWRPEKVDIEGCGSYLALGLGAGIAGGVVECQTERAIWLPYVRVAEIAVATERARSLGADVLLEPREGPAGWRSVLAAGAGGEVALWQPKSSSNR